MDKFNLDEFKSTHPKLYKTIISAMDEYLEYASKHG